MVFRYPVDPSMDYIKRIVGVPGDIITYRDKQLSVNNVPVRMEPNGEYTYVESGLKFVYSRSYTESLGNHRYNVLINPQEKDSIQLGGVLPFPHHENCSYNDRGFTCKVPPGNYFAMGDNRDSSSDSRYWGFVPDQNIVGKAFMIWWNFSDLKRIGLSIKSFGRNRDLEHVADQLAQLAGGDAQNWGQLTGIWRVRRCAGNSVTPSIGLNCCGKR